MPDSAVAQETPHQPAETCGLRPIDVLQPVFNALLASYASVDANVPLELTFCLPSSVGPCLLTVSFKSSGDAGTRHVRSAKGGLTPRQLRLVFAHMNQNLSRPIAITELSEIAGLSGSHFQRAFKESTGHPPRAYLTRLRIERSKVMMRETAEPFSQIALACGLADQAHFSRLFRRVVGATPTQWRHATCT